MKMLIEVTVPNAGDEEITREEMEAAIEDEGGFYQVAIGWCEPSEDWKLISLEGNWKENKE